jgi:hypothetical protein
MSYEAVAILTLVAFNLGLIVGMILGRSHFIR